MAPEREWVSIRDPDNDGVRYTFDVSFLLSRYDCIYGQGCPGVTEGGASPELGCCIHGAYLVEDEEPEVAGYFAELTPDVMQFHDEATRDGYLEQDDEDEVHTRVVDGACIFLNRTGFAGGTGCAFHVLATARGEHHMTYKPTVCWQVPLHRSIEELVANDGGTLEVHTIAAFERGTWGEGGAHFHWWCTEEPSAFVNERPVYLSMEWELREMVGDKVYQEVAEYCRDRASQATRVQFLPLVATS